MRISTQSGRVGPGGLRRARAARAAPTAVRGVAQAAGTAAPPVAAFGGMQMTELKEHNLNLNRVSRYRQRKYIVAVLSVAVVSREKCYDMGLNF